MVERQSGHRTVWVELGERRYPVHIGLGLLSRVKQLLPPLLEGRSLFVGTDEEVGRRYLDSLLESLGEATVYAFPPGEAEKSLDRVQDIYRAMAEAELDRQAVVLALGGGVVGDTVGFAASTYLRGLDLVLLPTTLLGMVDSAVGGKVGVNLAWGKNLVGSFHQPLAVVADLEVLRDLPDGPFRDGLAEVIKYGMIADPEILELLQEELRLVERRDLHLLLDLVGRCAEIKAAIVAEDERDREKRAVLNFGHTIGHALEAMDAYRGLTHGQAVAVGMVGAVRLGERLGISRPGLAEVLEDLLAAHGLPTRIEREERGVEAILEAIRYDKKRREGALVIVLTPSEGTSIIHRLDDPESILREVLSQLMA